jgi:quercetin dioxygenase-like cupin family protein
VPKLYFASARDLPLTHPQAGLSERTLHGQHVVVRCTDLDAQTIVETHRHDEERVGVVTRGAIAMVVAGEQRILTVGDTYVVPARTAHGLRVLEQSAQLIEVSAHT